jgi:glycerol kinase
LIERHFAARRSAVTLSHLDEWGELPMDGCIVSIDQGTTSCRAIVFDKAGKVLGLGQKEFAQHFPQPGWVEHDANEIFETQVQCIKDAVSSSGVKGDAIKCVGITNQRETTVLWKRSSLAPIHRAIVWQCRRTQEHAEKLKKNSAELFKQKTGLIPDAYFSGPKIKWLLDNVTSKENLTDLAFGTIDSWLIAKLSEENNHLTDPSNASRTMLYNINDLKWDDELLELIGVPSHLMPKVVPSNALFGHTKKELVGFRAPILAVLGDQQAAMFGQGCFEQGMFKCTYGTGSFILGNTGQTPLHVHGLLTTIGWQLSGEKPVYALEGATFIAGAAIQWLRDSLGIISSSDETEALARSIKSNEGVYFVPAFVGMGSPWWDSSIRGTITGLTRGSGRAHLVRAAIESMAYQIRDIADEIGRAHLKMTELRVDGGATNNSFLLEYQSDLLKIPVKRAQQVEATAWGVAALAGMTQGLITKKEFETGWQCGASHTPKNDRESEFKGWQASLAGACAVAVTESQNKKVSVASR